MTMIKPVACAILAQASVSLMLAVQCGSGRFTPAAWSLHKPIRIL